MNANNLLVTGGFISDTITRSVSLSENDVVVTDMEYTGEDLTKLAVKENEERTTDSGIVYKVDSAGWTRTFEIIGRGPATEIRNAGDYVVTYKKEGYETFTKKVIISPKEITSDMVSKISSQSFTGKQIKPEVTVKYNGMTLNSDGIIDYTAVYGDNIKVGEGTVKIIAANSGNYTGEYTQTFTINRASIAGAKVTINPESANYDGSAKDPEIVVTLDTVTDGVTETKTLIKDVDYTLTPSPDDLVSAGTVTYTIEGAGNYTDMAPKVTFTINPLPVTINLNSLTAENREYDGTNEVELKAQCTGILDADKNDVKLKAKATISSADVGAYSTVRIENMELVSENNKHINYTLTPLEGDTPLSQPVVIRRAKAPATPEITYNYNVSSKDNKKFYCTRDLDNAQNGVEYKYKMDDGEWTLNPVFDNIVPESKHTFYAQSVDSPNIEQSAVGEKEVIFEKLETENGPAAFKLEFAENEDGETLTATIPLAGDNAGENTDDEAAAEKDADKKEKADAS